MHLVFGNSAAAVLRDALAVLGRTDSVAASLDDLSFGPIDPPDLGRRARWVETELRVPALPAEIPEWRAEMARIAAASEAFWQTALDADCRRILWLSRRVAREYCGFLECVWRLGDLPCDVVDLSEVMVASRNEAGEDLPLRLAMSLSPLVVPQIVEHDLLAKAVPLSAEARTSYLAQWQGLRQENAPLRIIDAGLALVSAPLAHFDADLLSFVEPRFRKAAYVIGSAMMKSEHTYGVLNAGDFLLAARLRALAAAGLVESKGDLTKIRYSEVRLPALAPAAT